MNLPLLRPQGRLALFSLLGLVSLLLTRVRRPVPAVALALLTVVCFGFVLLQTEPWARRLWLGGVSLGERAGQETTVDGIVGLVGLALVLEAARRAVGWTLPILAGLFLIYARVGAHLPDGLFPHRGYPWARIVSQTFLHSQGVFGIALKVMFTYVFPFVLFGAALEATGATGFILELSRRIFRRSAGAPAKVAVLSSGLMGSLSGSAVANTATTGTFTIPMMRSAGFSPTLAAGIEAAASSGGALMPPIMGAGAYMMLEIVDPPVTYLQIIRAALIPALLYYLTLLWVVHLHARRQTGAGPLESGGTSSSLVWAQGAVFLAGMLSLIVCLLLGFTAFRSVTVGLGAVLLSSSASARTRLSPRRLGAALVQAARAAEPLIAAAACVGLILGVVTLTGVGTRLPGAILPLAQQNLPAALALLMLSTLILGLGLPSAVCYLLMATLVGPVLTGLGVVPLAAHLFIFYFGMMSMVTPPVALAAYTAAGLAGAPVMRTGWVAFRLAAVGFLLPYAFVLNPALLLLDATWLQSLSALLSVGVGLFFLAIASAGYLARELRPGARALLLVCALATVLVPGTSSGAWALRGGAIVLGAVWTARHARGSLPVAVACPRGVS